MMLNLSRENAINLINDVRKNVSQEIDLAKYFGEEFSKNIMEQNELTMDVQGISNGFLAEILCMILGYDIEIYGEVEALFPCPCCGLRTLTEEYNVQEGTGYDICPYCNWEDDGTSDINEYRSINRGSINVNIRIDEELKKQTETLLSEMGLNMTTAVNIFLRQVLRTGGIPFEITTRTDDFYNPVNQQRLRNSINRLEKGLGAEHELIEVEE